MEHPAPLRFGSPHAIVAALRTGDPATLAQLRPALESRHPAFGGRTGAEWLRYYWPAWARADQLMPAEGSWETLFLCAGRGGGKTRPGAELTIEAVRDHDVGGFVALIAPTYSDISAVMINGESGILACSPPWFTPRWKPGGDYGGELHWPNGVVGYCFTAERPEQIRGPQFGWFWGDEIAKWDLFGGDGLKVLSNIEFAHRLGRFKRGVLTSTPKPTPLVLQLAGEARAEESEIAHGTRSRERRHTILRQWSTYANRDNLGEEFVQKLERKYGGSTRGREEIDAEIITSDPLAAWQQELIDLHAVSVEEVPELVRAIVAVDNATEEGEGELGDTLETRNRAGGRADTALILMAEGVNGHVYVFGDRTTRKDPLVWTTQICESLDRPVFRDLPASAAVVERNAGGALIDTTLRLQAAELVRQGRLRIKPEALPVVYVRAKDGKHTRADPVVTLYQQGRVHHVRYQGRAPLRDLEFQQTKFRRGKRGWKKDRVDALVWGVTYLAVDVGGQADDVAERFRAYS